MRKLCFSPLKKIKKNPIRSSFFSMEYHVYWLLKSPCFDFFGNKKDALFWAKKLMNDIYWLLKSSSFEHFENGKHGIFWDKKLMERWYLLISEEFLFWTFQWWKIRPFMRQRVDRKMIFTGYWKVLVWATVKFLFWTFQWCEIRYFFSQNIDVKKMFTSSFCAFHDILELGTYGFLRSLMLSNR